MTLLLFTIVCSWLAAACGSPTSSAYLAANGEAVNRAVSSESRPMRFVVESGTPARLIGQNLQKAGLIGDELLFEAYVRANGLSTRLAAGVFILSPDMTLAEIVVELQRADAGSVTVTIREGWRLEQVADFLTRANVFGDAANGVSLLAESYRQQTGSGVTDELDTSRYLFLQSRPVGSSLEGYLFPDTYQLPNQAAIAADLIGRQLDTFAQRVAPIYEAAYAAGATTLDLHSVLTLASIVEREAVVAEERPLIAGVYLNRLAQGMRLEADPTVQYALGFQAQSGQWWKTPVFLEEYSSVESPYNTYLQPGLPPGPIASPGLSSIQAVLTPADSDYLFFVALGDGSGRHIFAQTFEEHFANVQKYQK